MSSSPQRRLDRASRRIVETTRRHALRVVVREVEPQIEARYRRAAQRIVERLGGVLTEAEVLEALRAEMPTESELVALIRPALERAVREGRDGAVQTLRLIEGGAQGHRPFVESASPTRPPDAS